MRGRCVFFWRRRDDDEEEAKQPTKRPARERPGGLKSWGPRIGQRPARGAAKGARMRGGNGGCFFRRGVLGVCVCGRGGGEGQAKGMQRGGGQKGVQPARFWAGRPAALPPGGGLAHSLIY